MKQENEEKIEPGTITKEIMYFISKARSMRVRLSKKSGTTLGFFTEVKIYNETVHNLKEFNSFPASFGHGTYEMNTATFLIDLSRWDKQAYGIGGLFKKILKVGDVLYFRVLDNSHQYLTRAMIPADKWNIDDGYGIHPEYNGFHNDSLFVNIYRKEKLLIDSLLLDSSVMPDNSARALQRKTHFGL